MINLIGKKGLAISFRKVVLDLMTEYKKAICTMSDGGYYVARTDSELDAAPIAEEQGGARCLDLER